MEEEGALAIGKDWWRKERLGKLRENTGFITGL
jgi:hypothetical protein